MSRPTTPTPTLPNIPTTSNQQFSSPPRSNTLPSKTSTTKIHHHHHHHRSHHHRDKSIPQTAIERTTAHPFGDLLRLDRPHHRRRGSNGSPPHPQPLQSHPHHTTAESTTDLDGAQERRRQESALRERQETEQRRAKWAEVRRLRLSRQEGQQELRQTLTHLNDLSTKMTRRLDYTYFALLTSLSELTTSVNAFLALAKESRRSQEGFEASVAELERETRANVKDTNEILDRQVERIGTMQGRMKKANERVERLSERLERVRRKVGEAEERDGEGVKRSGRRMTMMWSMLGTWLGVVVLALVLKHSGSWQRNPSSDISHLLDDALSESVTASSPMAPSMSLDYVTTTSERPSAESRGESQCSVDADATLRLFDNL